MSRVSKKVQQSEQLILAMLQQPTLEKAAAAAGISPTTAWRLNKTPEFQQELRKARRKVFGDALARMQLNASAAVDTILCVMNDPKTPARDRLRAAEFLLNHAAKAEIEDLSARVDALEQERMPEKEIQSC